MSDNFDIRGRQNRNSDKEFENALRPLSFDDFSGQEKIVSNLNIFVQAARMRGESLDHVLLHGPPGLGKTTLSNIIANELGVGFPIVARQMRLQGNVPLCRQWRSKAVCKKAKALPRVSCWHVGQAE